MGFSHNGKCFATLAEASQSFCTSVPRPTSYNLDGAFQEVYFFCSVGADSLPVVTRVVDYWDRSNVWGVPHTLATDFAPCSVPQDEQIVGVSISLFYLFLGILAAIWAGKRVYHLFSNYRSET